MEEKSTHLLRNEQLWLLTGGILLIAFVAFSFAMYFTRSFMIPFVFSIFLCAMVSPVDNLIVNRWKLPRWCGFIACIMTILFLFTCIFFVGKYAIGSINKAIQTVNIKIPESEKQNFPEVDSNLLTLSPTVSIPEMPVTVDLTSQRGEPAVQVDQEEKEEQQEEQEEKAEQDAEQETSSNAAKDVPIGQETQPVPETSNAVAEGAPAAEGAQPTQEAQPAQNGTVEILENPVEKNANEPEPVQKNQSQALEETIDYWLQKAGVDSEYLNAKVCISSVYAYIPAILRGSISTLQTFFSFSVLVLLFCVFILMGRDPLVKVRNEIYNEVEFSIQKYLNIKFFISFITGFSIYIVFLCLGAPMAFMFGVLAFVLNFIPSIGSIIATILPIPILMLTMDISHTGLFIAFFVPCLIQMFFGNFLDPKMQGEGLRLHPVTILLALGYFGVVWGIFGMLLAAPLTAALRVILLEFQMTRWIAQLMGGEMPSMKEVLEINERKKNE